MVGYENQMPLMIEHGTHNKQWVFQGCFASSHESWSGVFVPVLALFTLICAQRIYSMCLLLECQAWSKQVYHCDRLPSPQLPTDAAAATAVRTPHDTS